MDNPQGLNTVNSIEYVPEHIHRDNGNIRQKDFRANLSEEHRASINAKKPKNREKDGQKLRLPIQKCMKIILPTEENIRGKDMKK